MTGPHRMLNPESLPEPRGYSHAVVAGNGTTVYLGGQTGHDEDGNIVSDELVAQFEQAATNVITALTAAGGRAEDLVAMQIFVTDAAAYRSLVGPIGDSYRRKFGRHYPAIALLEVSALFDPEAKIELMCTAVIPA